MVILSFKEQLKGQQNIPDESFFLNGNPNLCFLIHGLTGTPKEMSYLGTRLHEKGYAVAAPLLAGHNQSLEILKRQKWQEIHASLKEEFLKIESGYQNIFVAGLSFGALLGMLLAYEFPQRIKAVICISPTLFFDGWSTPRSKFLLPFIYRTPLKYYLYFKEEYPYGIKNERLRSRIETYYKKSGLDDYSSVNLYGYPVIPVSCMYQNHLLAKHIMPVLKKISMPVQLLQAKNDDITSPRNSYYIYEHISSPDKEIVFLEDSYHIITADQERDKVASKFISFVERHTS